MARDPVPSHTPVQPTLLSHVARVSCRWSCRAVTTGVQQFGKGVYFADMSSKSANYCYPNREKTTGLMLLSEVALGNMYELTQAEYMDKAPHVRPPPNHHHHPHRPATAVDLCRVSCVSCVRVRWCVCAGVRQHKGLRQDGSGSTAVGDDPRRGTGPAGHARQHGRLAHLPPLQRGTTHPSTNQKQNKTNTKMIGCTHTSPNQHSLSSLCTTRARSTSSTFCALSSTTTKSSSSFFQSIDLFIDCPRPESKHHGAYFWYGLVF